jgi:tight adherence protein C
MENLIGTPSFILIVIGVLVLIIGVFIVIIGINYLLKGGSGFASRLEHYVGGKDRTSSSRIFKRIILRDMSGSVIKRVFDPLTKKVSSLVIQLTPKKQLEKLDHDLSIAGNPANLAAGGFFGLQILFFVVGALVAMWVVFRQQPIEILSVSLGVLIVLFCILLPKFWLNNKVRAVQDEIRRGLPDALDVLSVCASAGLGFDQSLQKISLYWQSTLGEELKRTIHEMEMGVPRSKALKNMADRLSVDDLSRFIAIITQAETMGMSYADVLHSQAGQMRTLRQFRAREIANRLPAKMIVPLAVLIFPALIAVILGPVIPTLMNLFV